MAGWHHDSTVWKSKRCPVCKSKFTPNSGSHKFCSARCRRKHQRVFGCETTDRQYTLINGRWDKYFNRLVSLGTRKSTLTTKDCLRIIKKQKYRCALSNVPLTCMLKRGVITSTNASIDRKNPKAGYTPRNVHIVCAALNKFRIDTPLPEFISWCRKVANHAVQKQRR